MRSDFVKRAGIHPANPSRPTGRQAASPQPDLLARASRARSHPRAEQRKARTANDVVAARRARSPRAGAARGADDALRNAWISNRNLSTKPGQLQFRLSVCDSRSTRCMAVLRPR